MIAAAQSVAKRAANPGVPGRSLACAAFIVFSLAASHASAAARVLCPSTGLLSPQYSAAASESTGAAATSERLQDARRDLERAAREIARLSAQAADGPMAELFAKLERTEKRPMLGVNIADIDSYPNGANAAGRGVRIVGVSPNGPADKAGIQTGDVVIGLNGQPLDDGSGRPPEAVVLDIMSRLEPGDPVAVRFLRNGTVNEVTAIAARFEDLHLSGLSGLLESLRDGSLVQSLRLVPELEFQGLELVEISPGLGAYFGTTEGLLVVRAPADSSLKLEDGDVILRIEDQVPASSAEALRLLRSASGDMVSIDILRHGEKMLLEAAVPAPASESRWSWRLKDE